MLSWIFHVHNALIIAVPTRQSDICWPRYSARSPFLSQFIRSYTRNIWAYQAVKEVSASFDALVDLLECIGNFLNRLDIYTKIPPTAAMTEVVVKILVELISTLTLATKQVKQGRPSECTFVDAAFGSIQCRKICEEASGRE